VSTTTLCSILNGVTFQLYPPLSPSLSLSPSPSHVIRHGTPQCYEFGQPLPVLSFSSSTPYPLTFALQFSRTIIRCREIRLRPGCRARRCRRRRDQVRTRTNRPARTSGTGVRTTDGSRIRTVGSAGPAIWVRNSVVCIFGRPGTSTNRIRM
jgi:hypothetical protein